MSLLFMPARVGRFFNKFQSGAAKSGKQSEPFQWLSPAVFPGGPDVKNNNQLVYTGALLAATLAFGQVTQAAPLILGGNQTISTDTAVESVVVGNTGWPYWW